MSAEIRRCEIEITEYEYFRNYNLGTLRFQHYVEVSWATIARFAHYTSKHERIKFCHNNIFAF